MWRSDSTTPTRPPLLGRAAGEHGHGPLRLLQTTYVTRPQCRAVDLSLGTFYFVRAFFAIGLRVGDVLALGGGGHRQMVLDQPGHEAGGAETGGQETGEDREGQDREDEPEDGETDPGFRADDLGQRPGRDRRDREHPDLGGDVGQSDSRISYHARSPGRVYSHPRRQGGGSSCRRPLCQLSTTSVDMPVTV